MYVIYGQKTKGDSLDKYALNSQIRFLSDLFDNKCWIFAVPGHMSRGQKVKDYIKEFNGLVTKFSDNEQYIAFGNGYNAVNSRNEYYEEIERNSALKLANYDVCLPLVDRSNHAKMLFYFEWQNPQLEEKFKAKEVSLSEETYCELKDNVMVRAVIIGSSNQSFNTLFRTKADKGEADVMLLESANKAEKIECEKDFVKDVTWENKKDSSPETIIANHSDFFKYNIISKSLFKLENADSDEDYLTGIFKKCLKGELYNR